MEPTGRFTSRKSEIAELQLPFHLECNRLCEADMDIAITDPKYLAYVLMTRTDERLIQIQHGFVVQVIESLHQSIRPMSHLVEN
jgi:hypothetical protein